MIGGNAANCYLVKSDDAVFVIDPYAADQRVIDFLNQAKERPKYVLLTHCHYDHILGAEKLREMFGLKIGIGEKDELGLRDTSVSLSQWAGLEQKPFFADVTFSDGDALKIGDTVVRVLHTPGHTIGSVCYIIENSVFTGDTLFEGTVGRTDFPTGDFSMLKASLEKLKALEKDCRLYPGHGLATTLHREMRLNPYMN